jgi:CheY-like chemotaxis protein
MPVVLVVDDAVVDQKIAGGLLESSGMFDVAYADSGSLAMEAIEQQRPDVVLTDLQMPDQDGLQLVTSIADQHPGIPVVLMTAHGSENVAAESLAAGAASFVPKTMLSEHLVATVMQVLAMSASNARYRKLASCVAKTDFEFRLLNDLQLIEPLIEMIQEIGLSHGFSDQRDRVQLGVALEAAIRNAMVHGNLEMASDEFPVATPSNMGERACDERFSERRVHFRACLTPTEAKFIIRDDGPGFDTSTVPARATSEAIAEGNGRGLVLMKSFMDEVTFNETGNEVTLVFRKK